jgi:hypothetical protein
MTPQDKDPTLMMSEQNPWQDALNHHPPPGAVEISPRAAKKIPLGFVGLFE